MFRNALPFLSRLSCFHNHHQITASSTKFTATSPVFPMPHARLDPNPDKYVDTLVVLDPVDEERE